MYGSARRQYEQETVRRYYEPETRSFNRSYRIDQPYGMKRTSYERRSEYQPTRKRFRVQYDSYPEMRSSSYEARKLERKLREEQELRRLQEIDHLKQERELQYLRRYVRSGARDERRSKPYDRRPYDPYYDKRRFTDRNYRYPRSSSRERIVRREVTGYNCRMCSFNGRTEKELDIHEKSLKHMKVLEKFESFSESSGQPLELVIKTYLALKAKRNKREAMQTLDSIGFEEEASNGLYKINGKWRTKRYDRAKALGTDFVAEVTGFYCRLCHKFYYHKNAAYATHCCSPIHFENLTEWLLKHGRTYEPGKYEEFLAQETARVHKTKSSIEEKPSADEQITEPVEQEQAEVPEVMAENIPDEKQSQEELEEGETAEIPVEKSNDDVVATPSKSIEKSPEIEDASPVEKNPTVSSPVEKTSQKSSSAVEVNDDFLAVCGAVNDILSQVDEQMERESGEESIDGSDQYGDAVYDNENEFSRSGSEAIEYEANKSPSP